MAHYERETHSYADGGFTTMGRVVDVLSHSPSGQRVTVLVEKSGKISFERVADEATSEGVDLYKAGSMEPVARVPDEEQAPRKSVFFCNAEKADGEPCEREVDHPEDTCWQHPDGED